MIRAAPTADRAALLVAPAAAVMVLVFVYPFLYGLVLSFRPEHGGLLSNYVTFFTSRSLWPTIFTTLRLALRRPSSMSRSRSRSPIRCAGARAIRRS